MIKSKSKVKHCERCISINQSINQLINKSKWQAVVKNNIFLQGKSCI